MEGFLIALIFELAQASVVCYTAVFSVVAQRSSPLRREERCVTTLKTAV